MSFSKNICWSRYCFESAHRLPLHKGKCQYLHGHQYVLEVGVVREGGLVDGMVLDFSEMKILLGKVLEKYDHSTILSIADTKTKVALESVNMRLAYTSGQPTAEVLALMLWNEIHAALENFDRVALAGLKLFETPDNWVELRV